MLREGGGGGGGVEGEPPVKRGTRGVGGAGRDAEQGEGGVMPRAERANAAKTNQKYPAQIFFPEIDQWG